jgi:succinate-semialdehyde dehydrogenase/glutarate-semialdehyde dehydrogenase
MKIPKKQVISSINPATLQTLGEVKITHPEEVESIVQSARKAFPAWYASSLENRARIIKRTQQLLLERSEEFAGTITQEMGRPIAESLVLELGGCIDTLGYYANRAHRFLDERKISLHHLLFKRRKSSIRFEPLGVLGIISPWNWPLLIPVGSIVPALLAGNAVVFKHSEITPLLSVKIRELFLEAGVPSDVFQIIQGEAETGKALVDSSVEKIFFTGSTAVGQQIFQQASRSLKKCVLEMGGSDPAIICDDADFEYTSSGLAWGAFSNCGQNCNGIERIYVHEHVADRLIGLISDKMSKLRIGDGMDPAIDIGPLSSAGQLLKMEATIEMAKEMGAEILRGGESVKRDCGYFFEPTLIRWDKSIPQPTDLEIFGPIVFITPVSDDDEAVRLANRSTFGLAASVWTSDARRGRAIAGRIESGTVMINDVIVSFGMTEASWTGIKNSGIGWVHGEKGLDEMVNIKYINRDPQFRQQNLWWFPYSQSMISAMNAGFDFLFSRSLIKKLKGLPSVLRHFISYLLLNWRRKDKL